MEIFLEPLGDRINQLGNSCLDVGCSTGYLSQYVAGRYIGIDISFTAISLARKAYPDRDFHVDKVRSGWQWIADAPVDTVVFGNVLHIYVDPSERINALRSYVPYTKYLIIYELEMFDHNPISKEFKLIDEIHGCVNLDIEEVKRHRKILVYEVPSND